MSWASNTMSNSRSLSVDTTTADKNHPGQRAPCKNGRRRLVTQILKQPAAKLRPIDRNPQAATELPMRLHVWHRAADSTNSLYVTRKWQREKANLYSWSAILACFSLELPGIWRRKSIAIDLRGIMDTLLAWQVRLLIGCILLGLWINTSRAEPVDQQTQTAKPGVVLEEFIFQSAPFPSCHAATIAEAKGDLVCAFFGGTAERNPDVCIWVVRKEKGSDHWTAPSMVADGVVAGSDGRSQRYPTWNPVLFQPRAVVSQSGAANQHPPLMLFYKVGPKPAAWWGMLTTSSDGGKTWSTPHKLGDDLIGPAKNKPIQLADGSILAGSSTENGGWHVHMERSTDGGKSWKVTGPLNDIAQFRAIQPTLLTYPGSKIQALCRTQNDVIAQTWSSDGGLTWSAMQKTELPNNNSGLDAVTLSDGRQLLVYNHTTRNQPNAGDKGRGILNVALSSDGQHWQAVLVLDKTTEPGKQVSYPSVIQTADGLVHIVYTWNRKRIKHVVLDPDKLITKPIVDGKWPDEIN
jgi:predicted neuraminidase